MAKFRAPLKSSYFTGFIRYSNNWRLLWSRVSMSINHSLLPGRLASNRSSEIVFHAATSGSLILPQIYPNPTSTQTK